MRRQFWQRAAAGEALQRIRYPVLQVDPEKEIDDLLYSSDSAEP